MLVLIAQMFGLSAHLMDLIRNRRAYCYAYQHWWNFVSSCQPWRYVAQRNAIARRRDFYS